jgi:hypothetical protein
LLDAADRSDLVGIPTRGYAFDFDEKNRRVFMLFAWDAVFVELIRHPLALRYVKRTIGDFLISNFSANITAPGAGGMYLHADQYYVPQPWGQAPFAVNVAWMLDEFTDANGATRVIPGSHRALPDFTASVDTVPVEGPAGSIMVMDGRVWHRETPAAKSNRLGTQYSVRRYVQPWIRPQINWNAALPPEGRCRLRPCVSQMHSASATATGRSPEPVTTIDLDRRSRSRDDRASASCPAHSAHETLTHSPQRAPRGRGAIGPTARGAVRARLRDRHDEPAGVEPSNRHPVFSRSPSIPAAPRSSGRPRLARCYRTSSAQHHRRRRRDEFAAQIGALCRSR